MHVSPVLCCASLSVYPSVSVFSAVLFQCPVFSVTVAVNSLNYTERTQFLYSNVTHYKPVIKLSRDAVPPPVFGVPPPKIAVQPLKVVVPPP